MSDSATPGAGRPTGISEIVLVVRDFDASVAFYRDIAGLTFERPASDDWAWFRMGPDDAPQRLALHKGSLLFEAHSPHPAGNRWGSVHFALQVKEEDLPLYRSRAEANGVTVHGPTTFEWMKATSIYLYDPDGNLLEFWAPNAAG